VAEADWVWMGENRSVPALPPLMLPLMPPLVMAPLVLMPPRPEPRPDLLPAAAVGCDCVRVCADIDACLPAGPSAAATTAADWLF